jgi:hypothetical protein
MKNVCAFTHTHIYKEKKEGYTTESRMAIVAFGLKKRGIEKKRE